MSEPPTSTPASEPKPAIARRWLVPAGLLLLAAALVALVWFSRTASRGVTHPPSWAELRLEIFAGGRPAPNARVAVLTGDDERRELRTDATGHIEVHDIPRAIVTVLVEVPGAVRVRRKVDLGGGRAALRIDLEPGNVLRGRVHDESDLPVADATVVARIIGDGESGLQEPWSVSTAADGSFVVDTLPSARITLEVSDQGRHESAVVAEVAVPGHEIVDVLMRRTAGLSGRVLDADRKPLPAVPVTLAGSGVWPARVKTSDSHGEFVFERVPEGVYEVRAELGPNISAPIEGIAVGPGNVARVELMMSLGVTLRGLVRDIASGRPIKGADVEVVEESLSAAPKHAPLTSDGRFEIKPLRALRQRVTVRAVGYVTEQRWLLPDAAPLTLELLRAVTVSGSVEDANGRSVALAEIEISGRSETGYAVHMLGPINEPPSAAVKPDGATADASGSNLGVTQGALPKIPLLDTSLAAPAPLLGDLGFRTDTRGRFRLEGLPPGELVLAARKAGFGIGRSRPLHAQAGAVIDDVSIVLPLGAALTGRVLDNHGMPVAHVRVDVTCTADAARSTVSADDGEFRFEAVRGPCTVQARPLGAPVAKLEVAAAEVGRRELELVLESATDRLLGRVLDSRQRPIEAASVHLETGRGRAFVATVVSASDGTFEFEALPAPPYTLVVEHADYTPSSALTVTSTSKPLLVTLEAGADLTGIVIDSFDQAPLAGAHVSLKAGDVARSARTGRDGNFEFRHVPAGNCELSIEALRHVPKRVVRALEANAEPLFERVALDRAGSVTGDVVDRLGATVWNVEVAAGNPADWDAAVRTDHAGHFELPGLAAGEQLISARHLGQQALSATSVRVYPGEESRGVVLRFDRVVDTAPPGAEPNTPATDPPLTCVMHDGAVQVDAISPGSAAARGGLEAGDVLLSVDGEPVRSAAQARGMLAPVLGRSADRIVQVSRAGQALQLRFVNGP